MLVVCAGHGRHFCTCVQDFRILGGKQASRPKTSLRATSGVENASAQRSPGVLGSQQVTSIHKRHSRTKRPPLSISATIDSIVPSLTAVCTGVLPSLSGAFGFAPFFRSNVMISALAKLLVSSAASLCRGVIPSLITHTFRGSLTTSLPAVLGLAPLSRRNLTTLSWPFAAASRKAVPYSPASIFAPLPMSSSTVFNLPSLAAICKAVLRF